MTPRPLAVRAVDPVSAADGMIFKDTKIHQMRRVSIEPTVELLRKHKEDCTQRTSLIGLPLRGDT